MGVAAIAMIFGSSPEAPAQSGFPDSLRKYSDNHHVPFRIGTAVTLQGGPSLYPVNGYLPGLLSGSERDRVYQALIARQFNQVEPGNEFKMMSLWTGGAARVNGRYVAKTNLSDPSGPLMSLCRWAESQPGRLTVRGHCMVYNPSYTLPTFPKDQPPLFVEDKGDTRTLSSSYQPRDLRDMLQSYVEQVVDATMAQNAQSRMQYGYKVVAAWDVTNEVVSDDDAGAEYPGAGFAYRSGDPWYRNGPRAEGAGGYDYIGDIYRWAFQRMKKNIGTTLQGRKITSADSFLLYYNDYNLEWSAPKMARVLNLIRRIRHSGGNVDGLGFQAHTEAGKLNASQFATNIKAAIQEGLRFSITENDITITPPATDASQPSIAQQEQAQGREYGATMGLCLKYRKSCDAYQIWGATDDGSWLQNKEATPFTRWISDTRIGATHNMFGYWPKMGQYAPQTLFNPKTNDLDPHSGHNVSDAYAQLLTALKAP
ncbi:hypothetical protein CCAX7_45700 [Capsulimonas corticalis]|uniref:endo-1,4-beta-xylanase n=1 Tax=Capsulimonas corticalis TaxID=2219043 RepID=A0A402D638_9BACT|nr:endo-1,4-beta-xylanase [Capsulimonas corticalis]BDI32519.1 hypothetical protein CCAX7_45700 [Capsulimonas corticalis]